MSDEATETETVAAAAEPDDEDATQMDVGVAETPNTPTAYSEDTEPPALVEYKQTRRRVLAVAAGILAVACAIAGGIVAWTLVARPRRRATAATRSIPDD